MKRSARFFISASLFTPCIAISAPVELPHTGPVDGWKFSLGVASVINPVYSGAKDYALSIVPDFRAYYGKRFFASIPEGVGYKVILTQHWKIGPLIKLRFGREEDSGGSPFLVAGESDALEGMGDIDAAGEAGGFVEYRTRNWGSRLELRQGFGGHSGLIGDVNVNYFDRVGQVSYTVGPRMTLASSDFMDTYYGVSPSQSVTSGYAPYSAGSGVVSTGIGASAFMPLSKSWKAVLAAGYDHLGEEASDSPFVESANQFSLIGSLKYGF